MSVVPSGSINEFDETTGNTNRVVYQYVDKRFANAGVLGDKGLQRRLHVIPFDPKTPEQVNQRNKMAIAVSAWQSLSQEDKNVWQKRGINAPLTGYQLFISAHMSGTI